MKASYLRNGRSASWAAHGTYLAREGAQREGGKGRGFAAEQEGIDLTATLRVWQRAGDARLWKFIVSSEHAKASTSRRTRGPWCRRWSAIWGAQLSGDIIKARARHQARLSDPRLPVALTRNESGTVITGRVVGTGLADELGSRSAGAGAAAAGVSGRYPTAGS